MAVTVGRDVRSAVFRTVLAPSWLALGLTAVPFLADVAVPPTVRYLPFLVSVVVLGLPHGATDDLVVARLGARRPRATVAVLYLVGGVAVFAAWLVAPALAFVGFVALTWYHWGQGDLAVLVALDRADHLRTTGQRALVLTVRGGIPMVVPLLAFPGVYRDVAGATVSLFGASGAALGPVFDVAFRSLAGGALAGLSLSGVALGYVRREPPGVDSGPATAAWRFDALETLLLWGFFLVVPPVLAVGIYFTCWHSLRHVARLVLADDAGRAALARGRPTAALARFARDALPNTLAALALLVALAAWTLPDAGLLSLLGLYLVVLAVLTLPHTVVVTWMDVREGVWRVPAGS